MRRKAKIPTEKGKDSGPPGASVLLESNVAARGILNCTIRRRWERRVCT
jgi:hypothetical protein